MTTRLPLFPLSTVLVPGLVLPLHVFEPRYRVLVQALMSLPEGATRQFGVVALRSAARGTGAGPDLYAVGCTAELREVTPYSDGRFDIVSVGQSRFRLSQVDKDAGTPYLTGVVDLLDEPDGQEDLAELTSMVEHRFARYREQLHVEVTPLPDDPQVVSYLITAAMVLGLPERQRLLEIPTTAERLRAEILLLRRETALLRAFGSLPATDLTQGEISAN
ncbi:MAG: uncharacterized protein QG608_1429 [Actinomycetota bacterium]|nr:uncharacterized protein [Actinomycetota bacterium]